jgi:hypothetical protein
MYRCNIFLGTIKSIVYLVGSSTRIERMRNERTREFNTYQGIDADSLPSRLPASQSTSGTSVVSIGFLLEHALPDDLTRRPVTAPKVGW